MGRSLFGLFFVFFSKSEETFTYVVHSGIVASCRQFCCCCKENASWMNVNSLYQNPYMPFEPDALQFTNPLRAVFCKSKCISAPELSLTLSNLLFLLFNCREIFTWNHYRSLLSLFFNSFDVAFFPIVAGGVIVV